MAESVAEIGLALRGRSRSAVEVAAAALDAIDAAEPALNAFVTVMREEALAAAAEVDRELARGVDRGALMGVPVALKDMFATRGVRTTAGSEALLDAVPDVDAPAVARLREAGAVIVGKTNMNELGWGLSPSFGRVNNPTDPSRTAGGSSGGSAACVGSGSVPVALGTDSGGSVRLPAHYCGVVGMKPGHGRIPLEEAGTLGGAGPLARSVADAATLLAAVADGFRRLEPSGQAPALALVRGSLDGLQPPVEQAVRSALAAFEREGAPLDVRAIDELAHWEAPWMTTFMPESAAARARRLAAVRDRLSRDLRVMFELGSRVPAPTYVRAQRLRTLIHAAVERALAGVDALVLPTADHVAPRDEPEWDDEAYFGGMRLMAPFNLTGHPAISLPVPGADPPVGVQLVGRRGGDEELLAVAAWAEEALGRAAS